MHVQVSIIEIIPYFFVHGSYPATAIYFSLYIITALLFAEKESVSPGKIRLVWRPGRAAVLPLSLSFLNKHTDQKTSFWVVEIHGWGSHQV